MFCSSTAAELAIRAGLDAVLALPADDLDRCRQIDLFTDSKSGLLRLSRGHCLQPSSRHLEVWDRLNRLADLVSLPHYGGRLGMPGLKGTRLPTHLPTRRR